MKLNDLIETLDTQFGNQYCPKQYLIIQDAVVALRQCKQLLEDNKIAYDN